MKQHKIVCIGDSITFGFEIETANRWTHLLAEDLDIEIINAGINGDSTAGMLSRFEQVLVKHSPTYIVIMGGTNDLWFGLKDEHIISNMYAMCKQAIHCGIEPIVGIPTPFIRFNELNFIGEDYAECIRGFQNILINFCKLKELQYIEFGVNLNQEHYMEDGLHPNAEGQLVMAKNAKICLTKILNDLS